MFKKSEQFSSNGRKSALIRNATIRAALAVTLLSLASAAAVSLPQIADLDAWDTDLSLWGRATLMPVRDLPGSEQVAVIAIDEATYADPELVGLPRVLWTPAIAEVQNAVLEAGAMAFGWDLILPTSAAGWVSDRQYDRPLLQSLARYGRKGQIVLGEANVGTGTLRPHKALIWAAGGPNNLRSLNVGTDGDGVVRALPSTLRGQDATGGPVQAPGMAMDLALRSGADPSTLPKPGAPIRVNFPDSPEDIPLYSFIDIRACAAAGKVDYLREAFAGRTILLGLVLDVEDRKLASNRLIRPADFAGAPEPCLKDRVTLAERRSTIPGVMIHAAGLANLLGQSALTLPPPWLRFALTAGFSLIVAAIAIRFRPLRSAPLLLGLGILWFLIAVLMLRQALIVLPVLDPAIAGALALTGGLGYRFISADRERARVRATFARYLDAKVVDAMLARGEMPPLGGERRELTCIFTDLAGFSGISEQLGPARLVEFLNRYFAVIGAKVELHGGIVERFLGDAICAVFGAPIRDEDHALNAVRTALDIQKALAEAELGLPEGMRANTRIGINSGDMVVGNIGSARRYTYTVMGDATNLAARLESGCKQFGTMVLMGDRTAELVSDRVVSRIIDRVRVVGRDQPVTLYEPLCLADETLDSTLALRKEGYEAALALQQAGRFGAALSAFEALAANGDPAAAKMAERTRHYVTNPPPADWDGVTDLTSK